MAGTGEGHDHPLGRAKALGAAVQSAWRRVQDDSGGLLPTLRDVRDGYEGAGRTLRGVRDACWLGAVRLGLLDFPVHPLRSRRALARLALIYLVSAAGALVAWQHAVATELASGHLRETAQAQPAQSFGYTDQVARPDLPRTGLWSSLPDPIRAFLDCCATAAARKPPPKVEPGAGMVRIPAGSVILGSEAPDYGFRSNEEPRHRVHVAAFEIDRLEVTQAQFYDFVRATRAPPLTVWGEEHKPPEYLAPLAVVGVTHEQARAYAAWAGKRLPTEAEWVRAARGDTLRIYPWGNSGLGGRCGEGAVPAVPGTNPTDRSLYGVMDMGGNVAEWTADSLAPFPGGKPLTGDDLGAMVVKGSSNASVYGAARCVARRPLPPEIYDLDVGFRCVKTAGS